jgi:hypothetical protein
MTDSVGRVNCSAMDARWWIGACVLVVLAVCAAPVAAAVTVRPTMGEYDTDVTAYR